MDSARNNEDVNVDSDIAANARSSTTDATNAETFVIEDYEIGETPGKKMQDAYTLGAIRKALKRQANRNTIARHAVVLRTQKNRKTITVASDSVRQDRVERWNALFGMNNVEAKSGGS